MMSTLVKTPGIRLGNRQSRRPRARAQKGAVLVIGLIILVVLTLLGVQGMRTNVAQERMAANMLERNVAFQAAEAALRVGESLGPFDGLGLPLADPLNWALGEETGALAAFDEGLESDPVYHVGESIPLPSLSLGQPPPGYFFPITARGAGRQEGSVVILRSGVIR